MRRYTAPVDSERCKADRKPLSDGTGARCMRRARSSGFCSVHERRLIRYRASEDPSTDMALQGRD